MLTTIKNWLRRIPLLEAIRAFMEQWGIWAWITSLASLLLAGALAMWAYMTSHLPAWAVVMVFGGALVILSALIYFTIGALARVRSLGASNMQPIDREALADKAEEVARAISSLLAEHQGRYRIAHEKDSARFINSSSSKRFVREFTTAENAKLIERFGDKYAADVRKVVLIAAKCLPIPQSDLWFLERASSEHDVSMSAAIMMNIAVELRHSQPNIIHPDDQRRLDAKRLSAEKKPPPPPDIA